MVNENTLQYYLPAFNFLVNSSDQYIISLHINQINSSSSRLVTRITKITHYYIKGYCLNVGQNDKICFTLGGEKFNDIDHSICLIEI